MSEKDLSPDNLSDAENEQGRSDALSEQQHTLHLDQRNSAPSIEPEEGFTPAEGADNQESGKSYSILNFIIELPILIAVAFLIAFLIKSYIVQPFYIPSASMEQTLLVDDRVLVLKFAKYIQAYEKGDILVFVSPSDGKRDFIKRVIADEGDTIEVKTGGVYVNDKLLDEDIYLPESFRTNGNYGPYKVPDGHLFMMGDNRNQSQDSRVFGAIKKDTVLGKAVIVYWPPSRIGLIN